MNSTVLLRATTSSHWRVMLHDTSRVKGTQSASSWKNVPCWQSRWANVFTPMRLVRSHAFPLVSSPVRCRSNRPAARCPTVLHPSTWVLSPAARRISSYSVRDDLGVGTRAVMKLPARVGGRRRHLAAPSAQKIVGAVVVLDQFKSPLRDLAYLMENFLRCFRNGGIEGSIAGAFRRSPKRRGLNSRVGSVLSLASSGRIQMPGRAPFCFTFEANPAMLGNVVEPSFHPSSTTVNGFGPREGATPHGDVGHFEQHLLAVMAISVVPDHSLPTLTLGAGRGAGHMCRQSPRTRRALLPRLAPPRDNSATMQTALSNSTPSPPLQRFIHRETPSGSICQKHSAPAPVFTP